MIMPATIANICTKCDKTDRSRMWVLRARHCMHRGFWGKVWKGARDGAKGIATVAKDAACALDTTCDHTARHHPYPYLAAAGVAAGVGLAVMHRGQGGRGVAPRHHLNQVRV